MSCSFCRDQEFELKKIGTMQLYQGKLEIQGKSYRVTNCPLCEDKLKDLDITKAIIIEDKAYCPSCREHDYRTLKGYRAVNTTRGKATEIKAECNKCGNRFSYLLKARVDKDIRFTEDDSSIKEIEEIVIEL